MGKQINLKGDNIPISRSNREWNLLCSSDKWSSLHSYSTSQNACRIKNWICLNSCFWLTVKQETIKKLDDQVLCIQIFN